jgi:hypothetical protein
MAMPEIDVESYYLIEWIYEIGFYISNGMGASVMPYSEIAAWAELTGNNPTSDDVRLLREMSSAFISMQELGKKSDTIDPAILLLTEV